MGWRERFSTAILVFPLSPPVKGSLVLTGAVRRIFLVTGPESSSLSRGRLLEPVMTVSVKIKSQHG